MVPRDRSDDPTATGSEFADLPPAKAARVSRLGALAAYPQLRTRHLRKIEREMTERSFDAGDFLMRQGERGDDLMIVQAGRVEIRVTSGENEHVLKRGGPGEVLGEMALLTREPRTADVVALTPVQVLLLPIDAARRLLTEHPELAEVLSHLIARRLGREIDALAGKNFHGYTIRSRLGRGGQSVVYEATEHGRDRHVALKMLSHALVFRPRSREAFRREAALIESFDHPHIVHMLGRFKAFSTFFIVMEFCDGDSLDVILARRGRIGPATVRHIVGQLASALAYAHERNIVHRDLKPSNVMVNRDGVVKLTDFGLARPSERSVADIEGTIAGTPRYMAPEQIERGAIGTATDLFGLAGLAWEMLSGDSLFEARTFEELRKAQESWDVPTPEEAFPDLDVDLREFLGSCLARDPRERRADLEAMSGWAATVDYAALSAS
ncbi:MAG: protein kinase [Planctomycetota bacterium]|nr:protein kinase [Planctomycetota bacterium]